MIPTYCYHTSPLLVQWRLEERKQWIPGTPWPNLETGVGPADHYLPPAHRALWFEYTSEEDWHFRHFPVWVRTSWPNPRPRPSVLPNIYREMSANMAKRCWSGDQAVGLGRRPLPDGWICGINRTEDLTCTAVDRWRTATIKPCCLQSKAPCPMFFSHPSWNFKCASYILESLVILKLQFKKKSPLIRW